MCFIKCIELCDIAHFKNSTADKDGKHTVLFDFKECNNSGVSIITGPVGSGKTLLMKIIEYSICIINKVDKKSLNDDIFNNSESYIKITLNLKDNDTDKIKLKLSVYMLQNNFSFKNCYYKNITNTIDIIIKSNNEIGICGLLSNNEIFWYNNSNNFISLVHIEYDNKTCAVIEFIRYYYNRKLYNFTRMEQLFCSEKKEYFEHKIKTRNNLTTDDLISIVDNICVDVDVKNILRYIIFKNMSFQKYNKLSTGKLYQNTNNSVEEITIKLVQKLFEKVYFYTISEWKEPIQDKLKNRKYVMSEIEKIVNNMYNMNVEFSWNEDNKLYNIFLDIRGHELSSGQQQIIKFIYECITKQYNIILMDEPLTHVSGSDVRRLCALMKTLLDKKQIIIVTHQSDFINFDTVNSLLCIRNGINLNIDTNTYQKIILEHPEIIFEDNIIYCEGHYDVNVIKYILRKIEHNDYNVVCTNGEISKEFNSFLKKYCGCMNYLIIRDRDKISDHRKIYSEFGNELIKYMNSLDCIDFNKLIKNVNEQKKKINFAIAYFVKLTEHIVTICDPKNITYIDDKLLIKIDELNDEFGNVCEKYSKITCNFIKETYKNIMNYKICINQLNNEINKLCTSYNFDKELLIIYINLILILNRNTQIVNKQYSENIYYWYPEFYEIEGINYRLCGKWEHNNMSNELFEKILTEPIEQYRSIKHLKEILDNRKKKLIE